MNKLGGYITKLMTTVLDSEQEQFVRELALSELTRLNVDVNDFIRKNTKDHENLKQLLKKTQQITKTNKKYIQTTAANNNDSK